MRTTRNLIAIARAGVILTAAYIANPRRAWRLTCAYYSVHPKKFPAELQAAVAELAALHLPKTPVDYVVFPVRHGDRGPSYGTDNVTFVHPDGEATRLTLGGNPDWFGGLMPGQAARPLLESSRDRVTAALAALEPTPDVRSVRVRITP